MSNTDVQHVSRKQELEGNPMRPVSILSSCWLCGVILNSRKKKAKLVSAIYAVYLNFISNVGIVLTNQKCY